MNIAEEKVSKFYNTVGWESKGGITEDSKIWEDLRECAKDYVSNCRLRVMQYIPERGDLLLDMGSGPIQYTEYLAYSLNFTKRYCVDLSSKALREAKLKIGSHGVFFNKSFFDIDFDDNMFDCAISLHAIYHIDKSLQEQAVRKLIKITKPGKPIIIVYSNPDLILNRLTHRLRALIRSAGLSLSHRRFTKRKGHNIDDNVLYYFTHNIKWWERFNDVASIKMAPWRSFNAIEQKKYFPDNIFGKMMFKFLFCLEDLFPYFFVKHFRYPLIILQKKHDP